jgi:RimJ/RimL family protein N-acetyltransferase
MEYRDYGCRRTTKSDLTFWKEVYSDPDVKKFMALWGKEPSDTQEFWEYLNTSERFVVYDIATEELVGGFTLYHRENKTAEFGIAIHPKFRGIGLGKIVLDFLQDTAKDLGIKTLKADVYEENKPSLSLLRGNGFRDVVFLEKNI